MKSQPINYTFAPMKLQAVILFLDSLGGGELLVVIFFALLFFGSDKLPGLMRGMGNAVRTFKNAMNEVKSDIEQGAQLTENKRPDLPVPGGKQVIEEEIKNLQPEREETNNNQ